ncbi:MAG: ATP phosphoribosyltransferase regulatory subunit [Firmicutes bacterium]|nr:ATP phosphoribosyltransferase regulatory subunit [Bacillota bacterium]
MKNKEIPKGLRDFLPEDVKARRKMEEKALKLFRSYGYEEVSTPTFEYLEVIEARTGRNSWEELYLFIDREGRILSLRPEMTVAIARGAATHLREAVFPQRLCYIANVFRHVQPQKAQYREFWQMGIELLGASGARADAEVINIAVETLRTMGLDNFKISLNQIAIFNSLLDDSGLEEEEKRLVRRLVENKDLVELGRVLNNAKIEDDLKEIIAKLPVLHGGIEVLDRLGPVEQNRRAAQAVAELGKVYEDLKAYGVNEHIVIDMGVLRGLDYYTGIVFEGYSSELGYGLLGGGRYDNLLQQYGFPCPATGFAIGMDRLALVLKEPDEEPVRLLVGGTNWELMVEKARELREQGYIVETDVEQCTREELAAKAATKGNCRVVFIE